MVQALYEATGGDAIVCSDVGQHQMWAAQYYHFDKPRRWINSGGLGTMGFGLPAAMGAKVGCPDADGRLHHRRRLVPDEHAGARDLRAERDRRQGVHHEQRLPRAWCASGRSCSGTSRYSQVDMGQFPDFVKLAEAYGATGMRLTDKATLVEDMRRRWRPRVRWWSTCASPPRRTCIR